MKRKRSVLSHKCLHCKKSFPSKLTYTLHVQRKHVEHKRNTEDMSLDVEQESEAANLFEESRSEAYLKNEIESEEEVCYNSDELDIKEEPLLGCITNLVACDFCSKRFETHLLKNHVITKHKFTTCCLCNKSIFSDEHAFNASIEFNKQVYNCCGCFEKFSSMAKFRNHLITHLYCNFYTCIICKRRFKSETLFEEHLMHHAEISFICNICNIMFKQIDLFRKHTVEQHVGTEYYATMISSVQQLHKKFLKISCELCEKEFKLVKQLCTHILTEHSDPTKNCKGTIKFPCTSCSLLFERECDLQEHVSLTHVEKTAEIPCHFCNTLFERECLLREHITATHVSKRLDIVCQTCNKYFACKSDLERHIADTHTTKKPGYPCQHCDTIFESKGTYMLHVSEIRKNAVVRYKTCEFCGKYFKRKPYLRDHIARVHSDAYRVTCDVCNDEFRNKFSLDIHIAKVHLQAIKFICQQCNKQFNHEKYLRSHILRRHTNRPKQSCDCCDKKFKSKNGLKYHLLKFHKNSKESTK